MANLIFTPAEARKRKDEQVREAELPTDINNARGGIITDSKELAALERLNRYRKAQAEVMSVVFKTWLGKIGEALGRWAAEKGCTLDDLRFGKVLWSHQGDIIIEVSQRSMLEVKAGNPYDKLGNMLLGIVRGVCMRCFQHRMDAGKLKLSDVRQKDGNIVFAIKHGDDKVKPGGYHA